ncbi:MAG: HD domain-containing protein [Chitinophagales bacterium]|nr:HD domain-containing protein [Chitinophagales bacterium]
MNTYAEVEEYIIGKLKRELPKDLYYHGLHHTLDVLRSAQMIGKEEQLNDKEMLLLKVAVLYHDAGFTKVYKNHEEVGCQMAKEDLPRFGFSAEDIDTICGMIMATKIPQSPKTKLEEIIADADLEYLGTDQFEKIGRTLYEEIKIYLNIESERQWNIIQINFLQKHHYFTNFCKQHREPLKQAHLAKVIEMVEGEG